MIETKEEWRIVMDENSKVTLEDLIGIVDTPKIEGRFQEIISIKKIIDTVTGKEYDGLVDSEFLIHVNEISKENEHLKKEISQLAKGKEDMNYLNNDLMESCFKRKALLKKQSE